MLFSKLEAHLRRITALTLIGLSMAIKEVLDVVTLSDIQGFVSTLGFPKQEL